MKRLFKLLIVMFVLYLLVQVGFRIFGKGNTEDYEIQVNDETKAQIHEVYTNHTKDEKTNYFFTIKVGNQQFNLQTYQKFTYASRLIKKVKYYQGTYTCVYPIFKKYKQLTDVICLDQGVVKNYQQLKGRDEKLDEFVKNLEKDKLYTNQFVNNIEDEYQVGALTVYKKNVIDGHYIAVNNYRGIYTINNNNPRILYDLNLFKEDAYHRNLTALSGHYYMSANYDDAYEFNSIKIVNIKNNEIDTLELKTPISFNSYVQGVVDGEVYIVDKANRKQYKVNVKDRSIYEIGNESTPSKFYDGENENEVSIYDVVNNEKYFNTETKINKAGYARADKKGSETSGYYYYYKQVGNKYEAYRASIRYPEVLTYLFTTTDITHISYVDDYVYYYIGNTLNVYHDSIGNRTIYKNTEYEFNKSLNYYVYKK